MYYLEIIWKAYHVTPTNHSNYSGSKFLHLIRKHRSTGISGTGVDGSSSGADLVIGDHKARHRSVVGLANIAGNKGDGGLVKLFVRFLFRGLLQTVVAFK